MITGKLMYDLDIEVADEKELNNLKATITETLLKKTQGITDVECVDEDLDEEDSE